MTRAYVREGQRPKYGYDAPKAPGSVAPVAMPADASASHGAVVVRGRPMFVRALVLMASGASVGILIAMVLHARGAATHPHAAAAVGDPTHEVPSHVQTAPVPPPLPPLAQTPLVIPQSPAKASATPKGIVAPPLQVVPPSKDGAHKPNDKAPAHAANGKTAAPPPPVTGKKIVMGLQPQVEKTPQKAPAPPPRKTENDADILKRAQQTTSDTL
jgi:hypothetical protein